jgi:hypothetical protein
MHNDLSIQNSVRNNIFLGLLVFCIKCIIIIILRTHVFFWKFRCLKGIKVQQRSLYFVPPSIWYCPRHNNINCKIPPEAIQPKYIYRERTPIINDNGLGLTTWPFRCSYICGRYKQENKFKTWKSQIIKLIQKQQLQDLEG